MDTYNTIDLNNIDRKLRAGEVDLTMAHPTFIPSFNKQY